MVPAEIPQTDVFRRVVIRVVPVPAFQAFEVLVFAVVRVCESTVRTPTRRVLRVYLFYADAVFCGLVFDVLVETVECPPGSCGRR